MKNNTKYLKGVIQKALISFCIITIVLIGIINANLYSKSFANSNSKMTFNNIEITNTINSDGTIQVEEKLEVESRGFSTLVRTFGKGVKKENITSISVINNDKGTELNYTGFKNKQVEGDFHLDVYEGELEVGIGIPNTSSTTRKSFTVKYLLNGAVTKYQDFTEVYYKPIDAQMKAEIKDFSFKIRYNGENSKEFPFDTLNVNFDPKKTPLKVERNNVENIVKISKDEEISYKEDGNWNGGFYEYRIFASSSFFPNMQNSFETSMPYEKVMEQEKITNNINEAREKLKVSVKKSKILSDKLFDILIPLVFISIIIVVIRKIKIYNQIKKDFEEFGVGKYYTDIPDVDLDVVKIATLEKQAPNYNSIIIAVILKLIHLKVFEVQDDINNKQKSGIFSGEIKYKKLYIYDESKYQEVLPTLNEVDKLIYTTIRNIDTANEGKITEDEVNKEFAKKINQITSGIHKVVYNAQKENENIGYIKKVKRMTLFPTLILITLIILVISAIVLEKLWYIDIQNPMWFALVMLIPLLLIDMYRPYKALLTPEGIRVRSQIDGLKRQLKDFSYIKELDEKSTIIWEKFLIYATTFGISKLVLENIKKHLAHLENDNELAAMIVSSRVLDSGLTRTLNQAAVKSGNTSGSYGGGGFGGGGFGGR